MSLPTIEFANLSQRLLVACDQSYAGDELVVDENVLFRLDDAPLFGQFQPPFESSFPDYVVTFTYDDPATGFKGVVYRNESSREIVVALAGTDSTDLQDWWSNLTHYGWNQWKENRVEVLQSLDTLITRLQGPAGELPKIYFTGQSLGGALAQYAAYEFVETHREYARANLSLVTFNGLGGLAALREELPKRIAGDPIPEYPQLANAPFDSSLVSGFGQIAHYGSLNDLVWRAGAGHLGGNVYSFAGLDFANVDPATNEPFLLDAINAHKIETGFYYPLREFDRAAVSAFEAAVNAGPLSQAQLDSSYLKVDNLQKLTSILGNVFRQTETSSSGAMLKLLFGGMGGFTLGDSEQVNHLVREYVETRKRAGMYLGKEEEYEAAKETNWSFRMRVAAAALGALAVPGPFGLIMKVAGAIAFAPIYKLLEGISNDSGEFVLRQSFELQRQGAAVPEASLEESLERATLIGAPLGVTEQARALDLDAVSELAADDVEGFAEAMVSGDWYYETSKYLVARANVLGKQDTAQAALNEFWTFSRHAADGNPTLLATVSDQFGRFTSDWTNAVAKVNSDLITPKDTPIQVDSLASYSQRTALWTSVLGGLENVLDLFVGTVHAAETRSAVVTAINEVRASAEIVVLRPNRESNPFEDPSFDPDASPLAGGQLKEGSLQTFTAYLPYEAGPGGQAIGFTLGGGAADKLKVLGSDESELAADGTFTLTVAEGQREISFAIAALEDVDDDAAFTLSAQLIAVVDGVEVPTHLAHEELELALDAVDETAPAGGMEYRGDWGLKLYPSTNPDGNVLLDEDGNPIFETRRDPRYPPFTNLERDANGTFELDQSSPITGLDGSDHIWLGESNGSGLAIGMGGDDYFEGMPNVPNFIVGDDHQNLKTGNDTIEGGENLRAYGTYPGFTREGEHIEEIGDDILFGGPGNDDIYADRIALLGETLDPGTPALDLKGDWITGDQGDDRIFGSAARDALFGGGGADEIHGGAGDDVVDGDDSYENWGDAWWEVDPGVFGVTFFPVTNVRLQNGFDYYKDVGGDDVLDGGAGDDLVLGMLGNDTLIGGAGEDRLEGWEGDDQLFGGAGDDVLAGDFARYEVPWLRLVGANLRVVPGAVGLFVGDASAAEQVGNDFLDGGAGNDQLFGEAGDDSLFGRDGDDVLFGDAGYLPEDLHGNDLLDGGVGADSLFGNAGDDRLFGGADNDSLSGDAGDDQADGGSGDDSVSGGEGDDLLEGSEGLDTLAGDAGSDVLEGGGGNDQLSGGEGDDVLRGDAGADSLDGGAGADSLYGGSGEDVLSGGDGNDFIDGGAGIDVVRGGAGDDTYVFGLGYGQDLIEDGEGSNRLRFGAGIAPEDLSAMLDGATLSATIVFGAGDSATLNASAFQVGGVDFAGGTTWGRDQFLGIMPALASAGSDSAEVLVGNENLRNELRGLGGDDILIGSANQDLLDGGAGADSLDGGAGSDLYVFAATDGDIDTLADSGLQARAYLDWYYGNLGIADWIERGQHGGKYKGVLPGWGITLYYDTFEEASAEIPVAEISLVEVLPSIAPLVRRDDQAGLDELAAAGILSRDIVELGPGLALSDLTLSVTVNAAEAADHPDQPWYSGGMLSVAWGSGGFDLEVPGINYGFAGSNLLTDGSGPEADVPGAWRGYRLGEGIEEFRFADGTTYSLEEVLRQAAVVEVAGDYQLSRDSGTQLVSRHYGSIAFEADIRSSEISVSRDGTDLLITVGAGAAQARVVGWYQDPELMPSLSLKFASDPEIDAAMLTQMGLEMVGSEDDDVIAGLDGFDDVLSGGGGSDILDGGTGKDTYVFTRGDGSDTITDAPSAADGADASIVVLGAGIEADDVQLRLGSLVLDFGEGDEMRFTAFDADDPYASPGFEGLEFDDGSVMSYEEVLGLGFSFTGTDGDDVISGTGATDFMDGGAGNDTLYGSGGEDSLEGDEGDDTLAAGPGDDDQMAGGLGSDTYIFAPGDGYYDMIAESGENAGDVDTLRLTGAIVPADVRVGRDQWSYWLVFGDGDLVVIDNMAVEPASVVERIEFDDGTVWTPDDLAARVQPLPGTALDDALWGTPGDDALSALGGDDQLFGNGGDDVLAGGEGSDLYYFALGDGADVVDNYDNDASFDTIYFADASSTDATLAKSGNDLVIRIGEGADRVTLSGWYRGAERKVDEVVFVGDSVGWDAATLEQLAPAGGANNAPEVANPLADQAALEDEEFGFSIPQGTFIDPDGDELAYGATHPAWLSFDPDSRTFSGTPENADVGTFEVTVTAADTGGESVSDSFALEVINTNDAPLVAGIIADVLGREGEALAFSLSPGIFSDPDASDHLSLSAAMADGSALPGWLSFDGTSFSGTPGLADAGEYVIEVTARDDADATADTSLRVMVEDTPAPETLVGTPHKDVLRGTAADEVLVGLGGNDELRGGRGDDVYVHGGRDGHDGIVEAGGDFDVIRFGEGITREMVRAKRHHDDLVLDVSGPHGSVTVAGWFASKARRVEYVQFANGTVWDEDIIRRLVRQGDPDDDHHPHKHPERDRDARPSSPRADEGRQALVDWYRGRDATAAAIWERLSAGTSFDFDALLREPGSRQAAPDPEEIARQWARAHRYASALAFEADETASSGWQAAPSKLPGTSAAGFGFEASIGATHAQEGLRGLEGLTEGFRKL